MGDQTGTGASTAVTAAQISHIVDTAVNPFVLIDEVGTALWVSASVEELLGWPATGLVGRSMLDIVAPASVDAAVHALANATDPRRRRGAEPAAWEGVGPVLEMCRPDGTTVSCSIAVATPARTGLACFVLQLRRADASHALELALHAMGTDRPLREVVAQVVAVLQGELPDAEVVALRPSRRTGRMVAISASPGQAEHIDLGSDAPELLAKAVSQPCEVVGWAVDDLPSPVRDAATSAGFHWLSVLGVAPVIATDPATSAVVCVWSRAEREMHFLNHERIERCGRLMSMALRWEFGRRALRWAATHDALTGLHNRAAFLTELHDAAGARRRSSDKAAVLYLDLDDFKPVNEQHGHALGDRVLIEVAARLRAAVRPSDLVARLGGDEFAVLCPGLADTAAAEQLAQRLVADVSQPLEVEDHAVQIGLSVGIAILGDEDDVERVLSRADTALRGAKVGGKARWQLA